MAVIAPDDFLQLMKDDGNPQAFNMRGDGNPGFTMGGTEGFNMGRNGKPLAFKMVGDVNPLASNCMGCNPNGKLMAFNIGAGTDDDGKLLAFQMVCNAKMVAIQKGGDGKPLALQVGGQKVAVNETVPIDHLCYQKGIEMGEWALLLHNKSGRTNLQFLGIEGGWKGQVLTGMLYWLALTVKDKDDDKNNQIKIYEAAVVDRPGRNVRVLLRFQLLSS